METTRLTRMANDIARNFEALGHDAAVKSAAAHMIKFWDPRMKAGMIGGDRSGLSPIAAAAIALVEADERAKAA